METNLPIFLHGCEIKSVAWERGLSGAYVCGHVQTGSLNSYGSKWWTPLIYPATAGKSPLSRKQLTKEAVKLQGFILLTHCSLMSTGNQFLYWAVVTPQFQPIATSLVLRPSHRPGFDRLQYAETERRPGPFYCMNDVSVYLGRQMGGGVPNQTY